MKRDGFTLLELAVASALGVLLAGAASALFIRGVTAARNGETSLQQTYQLEKAADEIGRQLRKAVPSALKPFEGKEGEISFLASEGPESLSFIRYRWMPAGGGIFSLTREREAFPAPVSNTPPPPAVLAAGLVNFSVLYGMIDEQNGRRLLIWSKVWDRSLSGPAVVPKWVQVRLVSRNARGKEYEVTREFLIPQGVLKELSA